MSNLIQTTTSILMFQENRMLDTRKTGITHSRTSTVGSKSLSRICPSLALKTITSNYLVWRIWQLILIRHVPERRENPGRFINILEYSNSSASGDSWDTRCRIKLHCLQRHFWKAPILCNVVYHQCRCRVGSVIGSDSSVFRSVKRDRRSALRSRQ